MWMGVLIIQWAQQFLLSGGSQGGNVEPSKMAELSGTTNTQPLEGSIMEVFML